MTHVGHVDVMPACLHGCVPTHRRVCSCGSRSCTSASRPVKKDSAPPDPSAAAAYMRWYTEAAAAGQHIPIAPEPPSRRPHRAFGLVSFRSNQTLLYYYTNIIIIILLHSAILNTVWLPSTNSSRSSECTTTRKRMRIGTDVALAWMWRRGTLLGALSVLLYYYML